MPPVPRVGQQPQGQQRARPRRRGRGRRTSHCAAQASAQRDGLVDPARRRPAAAGIGWCDGTQVVEKVSSSPSLHVELVVVAAVVGAAAAGGRAAPACPGRRSAVITSLAVRSSLRGAPTAGPCRSRTAPPTRAASGRVPRDARRPGARGRRGRRRAASGRSPCTTPVVGRVGRLEDGRCRRRSGGSTASPSAGPSSQRPCSAVPSSAAKQAGESKRGRHSQSTEPSVPTSAAVRRVAEHGVVLDRQ